MIGEDETWGAAQTFSSLLFSSFSALSQLLFGFFSVLFRYFNKTQFRDFVSELRFKTDSLFTFNLHAHSSVWTCVHTHLLPF